MASQGTLTWNGSPGNTSYIVEYKRQDSSSWIPAPGSPTSDTDIQITLDEGVAYDFRVTGDCGSEISGPIFQDGISQCKPPAVLTLTPGVEYINLSWTTQPEHVNYTVTYKKQVDPTYVSAPGSPVLNPNPSNGMLTISGLDENTEYNVRIVTNCEENSSIPKEASTSTLEPIWIENTYVCEQDDLFTLEDTYTGFSSPIYSHWDETQQRFYIVDGDDATSNLYWIDPNTFTGFGDQTYIAAAVAPGTSNIIHTATSSESLRKIYMAGPDTEGVMVYNIATDTVSMISDGSTDGSFARLFCRIMNGLLYVSNRFDNTITIIDPSTDTVTDVVDVNSIPGNTSNRYFNNSYYIHPVNGELWVCAAYSRATTGNIGRYNSDFTSFLGEIVIPGAAVATGGDWSSRFWQGHFFDEDKQRFYLADAGSFTNTVIDTSINTVIDQVAVTNMENRAYPIINWSLNALTGHLYANKQSMNTPDGVGAINKFYIQDRDNYFYTGLYLNSLTNGLVLRPGTSQFWALTPGVTNPTAGWDTDGIIYKYSI